MIELMMRNLVSVDGERSISGSAARVEIVADGRVIGQVEATPNGLSISLGDGMPAESFAIEVADPRCFAMRLNWEPPL